VRSPLAELGRRHHATYPEKHTESLSDIRLNTSLFRSEVKKVSYGTIVQIDGLEDWTHANVVDLAFAAHAKFNKQFMKDTLPNGPDTIANLNANKDRPTVTTTLVGNSAPLPWKPPRTLRCLHCPKGDR
jgi:hypothetical protein